MAYFLRMLDKHSYIHARAHVHGHTHTHTHTHTEICNSNCFSMAKMICQRASILRYNYIACLTLIFRNQLNTILMWIHWHGENECEIACLFLFKSKWAYLLTISEPTRALITNVEAAAVRRSTTTILFLTNWQNSKKNFSQVAGSVK
jgi:hypothetical protein